MGDMLEDQILKQNVPGRYSSHDSFLTDGRGAGGGRARNDPEDGQDNEEEEADGNALPVDEDSILMEHARALAHADVPEPVRRGILAERQRKASTGVKGVLADYKAAQALDAAQAQAELAQRAAIFKRMTEGAKRELVEEEEEAAVLGAGEEDEDDEDDEFFRAFREQRMREIKAAACAPQFSSVKDVNSEQFVDELEKEDPRVRVVVHLYEPSVSVCTRLNRILDEIAPLMTSVKFLRLQAKANDVAVDRVALPILQVYRAGESQTVLAGISDMLGTEFFTKDDVVELLENAMLPS